MQDIISNRYTSDREYTNMDVKTLKSYTQKMYKVGFGSNLWGIFSENSLDTITYIEGAIEYVGEREVFYIPEEELVEHDYYV